MANSKPEDGKIVTEPLLTKLGGKKYLELKLIIRKAGESLKRHRNFLLLLQIPLLSAQEEVSTLLQLLGNVV